MINKLLFGDEESLKNMDLFRLADDLNVPNAKYSFVRKN